MSSLFNNIRQNLRAGLIASLLVLAHALLITASKAPQEARTSELIKALGTISALISVTLLWVSFTILEAADGLKSIFGRKRRSESGEEDEDEEEAVGQRYTFCMTWFELGFGLFLLSIWIFYNSEAELIMSAFASTRTSGLVLIRIACITAISSLALLQFHLVLSILWHAFWQGGITSQFWNEKTGWWVGVGKIRLERNQDDEEMGEKV